MPVVYDIALAGLYAELCFVCLFLFFFPFIIVALLLSLLPSRNSDMGFQSRLLHLPPPSTVRASHSLREKPSAISSLADLHRIVPTHATTSKSILIGPLSS